MKPLLKYNEGTREWMIAKGSFKDSELIRLIDEISNRHKSSKIKTNKINPKYKRAYQDLTELAKTSFISVERLQEWHIRIMADEDSIVDVYPKKQRYCIVKEPGVVNNRWGFYDDLIDFIKDHFEIN